MDSTLKQNRQMRSMGLALGASILAAVATMFVPVSVLESVTGSSGLSELVPATAAPLGDTARALIAFGAGALTLAILAVALLRQNNISPARNVAAVPADIVEEDDRIFASSLKERISKIELPRMPWIKGDDDITELSDLPRLRGGDVHPDAPARRPLSAILDLPVFDLTERVVEPTGEEAEPAEPAEAVKQFASGGLEPLMRSVARPVAVETQPTLAEMVAQLEASVAQRQQQLAELEIVATNLAATKAQPVEEIELPSAAIETEAPTEVLRPEWRPLGMVSNTQEEPDDMDEALAAALATLHRMNGTGR